VVQKSNEEKAADYPRLQQEVAAKNAELTAKQELIVQLQSDLDEQQRRLAKLRGSESETMRLKAISEKDRGAIDALEREIAQLREALARHTGQKNGAGGAPAGGDLEAKLKDRESSVNKLMGTVKEHEATIKKLSESVESWKRKYTFLSTDAPDAYKTASEK
jgi:chromosome segregation ATPase